MSLLKSKMHFPPNAKVTPLFGLRGPASVLRWGFGSNPLSSGKRIHNGRMDKTPAEATSMRVARWDAETARRGLNFLKAKAEGSTQTISGRSRGRWLQMLRTWAGMDSANKANSAAWNPNHISLPISSDGTGEDSILDIHGKLRSKGIRANLTLCSTTETDRHVHVTPIRASRSRAVRYIALRFGIGFGSVRHIVAIEASDAQGNAKSRSSDVMEIVGGMQAVLLTRAQEGHKRTIVDELCFEVPLEPFGGRVSAVSDEEQLTQRLKDFCCMPRTDA